MPQVAENSEPGSPAGASMRRSSPERKASAWAVIGSTATDASVGVGRVVGRVDHQPRVRRVHPQGHRVAGRRVAELDGRAAGRVADQVGERVVDHGPAQRPGHPEVERGARPPAPGRWGACRSGSDSERVAAGRVSSQPSHGPGPTVRYGCAPWAYGAGSAARFVALCITVSPSGAQVVDDVQVQGPRVAALRHQPVAQRHRPAGVLLQGPRDPAHQPVRGVVPARLGQRQLQLPVADGVLPVPDPVRPRHQQLPPAAGDMALSSKPSTSGRPSCSSSRSAAPLSVTTAR